MTKEKFKIFTETVYPKIVEKYGESKHYSYIPYIGIEDSPYSDTKVPKDLYGEYCSLVNEIILYWKNINSKELLIRTLIHEYQHYLQSPSWTTRYYKMGYEYSNHPYEIKAFKEEENWVYFVN
jgi:hypothetical protein